MATAIKRCCGTARPSVQRAPFTSYRRSAGAAKHSNSCSNTTPYGLALYALAQQEQRARLLTCLAAGEAATATADAPATPAAEADVTSMDIRVGKIVKCERHPDADR